MSPGTKYKHWVSRSELTPTSMSEVTQIIRSIRNFTPLDRLDYGDHGLELVLDVISQAIEQNKRIALYADYDVDGTMSCVSWIWFFQAINFQNFVHYIPCRFKEGYGVNLEAVKHLAINEKADVIITMDTGITANSEAEWCRENGVIFICTDHHKIQPLKMPDCLILNPKMHPDPEYQELCGCGITFILLRKLARHLSHQVVNDAVWTDILALTGMATICDVVPLNGVNHKLAKYGVDALMKSKRPVLVKLRAASSVDEADEQDIGFKLGPRINAVGRLEHADLIINAFIDESPDKLIQFMGAANERRRIIQADIVKEAKIKAEGSGQFDLLFLGGDWHPGVVGIAASKLAEEFWCPTWLFNRKDGICKGSARSIKGFDVTEAMIFCKDLFLKFGGHAAAGGFAFEERNEELLRQRLMEYAAIQRAQNPMLWESKLEFDCALPVNLLNLDILKTLNEMKPFGHGFEEPRFMLNLLPKKIQYFMDKATGEPKHTCVVASFGAKDEKVLFFNQVIDSIEVGNLYSFVVSLSRNMYRGVASVSIMGHDWSRAQI